MSSNSPTSSIFRFFVPEHPDAVKTPHNFGTDKISEETGMDRLRKMVSLDHYGCQSKELMLINQTCTTTFLGTFIIGGVMQSRDAHVHFIEDNQATKFTNTLDAKRQLQREMFVAFMKGGWRWGWRVGMFSLTFITITTSISVYRNKESLVEYVAAGATTGCLFKANMGLKGALSGTILGSALGLISGSLTLLVLKLTGSSMSNVRDFSKLLYDSRDSRFKEGLKQHMLKEHTDLAGRGGDEKQFENMQVDEKPK